MTTLLVGTLLVSGAHTLLWLPRSLQYRNSAAMAHAEGRQVFVRRFRTYERNLHLMVISSFLGPGPHGHDPEVLLRHLGQRAGTPAGRLRGGRPDPPLLRGCSPSPTSGSHLCDLIRKRRRERDRPGGSFLAGPDSMLFNRTRLARVRRVAEMVREARARGRSTAAGPTGRSSTTSPCSGAWP